MLLKTDLQNVLKENKVPAYRANQILNAVYKKGVGDFNFMYELPKSLRDLLSAKVRILSFDVEREVVSPSKNAVKTLFKMADGKLVEGVLMRFKDNRNSVCISSQVGCGLRCAFCSTGRMGFTRNLTAQEISDQVLYFDQMLKMKNLRVDHVVLMGMGEPMLNYEAVMSAIQTLNDPNCLGIAARRITLSTSGIIPGILKLAEEKMQINLAVSLHAPTQELRESLMPIAKAYKLQDLMNAVSEYIKKTKRRVSYEYVMLKETNDSIEHAKELCRLIKGQMCHVNLIPYNETHLGFQNSGKSRINKFREIIEEYKIPVTIRVSLGQDISAACGQLATN